MKKRNWFNGSLIMVLICSIFLVFSACDNDTTEYVQRQPNVEPTRIRAVDLTEHVGIPLGGNIPGNRIEAGGFTGSIIWMYAYNREDWDNDVLHLNQGNFVAGRFYRVMVTLNARAGYTFAGFSTARVNHNYGYSFNPTGTGTTLLVMIDFPQAEASDARLITATALEDALLPPIRFDNPVETITFPGQFTGTVVWTDIDGNILPSNGVFAPGGVYRAIATINPNSGWRLAGLNIHDGFSHSWGEVESINLMDRTITVRFAPTAQVFQDTVVSFRNLSTVVIPRFRQIPSTSVDALNNAQNQFYVGALTWFYTDDVDEEPIEDALEMNRPFHVVLDITPREGFTFNGFVENFFHFGEFVLDIEYDFAIVNNSEEGTATIFFDGAPWSPGTFQTVTSSATGIEICCFHTNNPPTIMLNGSNANHWDFGWAGAYASNLSSWMDTMTQFLPGGRQDFVSSEITPGHPSIFLSDIMPPAIRKRAHAMTLDLGSVIHNIVSVDFSARDDGGQRWAFQYEVFYSMDPIGPIPGINGCTAVSAGIVDVPFPGNNTWGNGLVYRGGPEGMGFSARYIHIRIYGTRATFNPYILDGGVIDASLRQVRVRRSTDPEVQDP
ncbi:MAG: hypothetical protein FWC97_04565 [Treponema sp.]|nr:hypothetical protein [Treponema sp.]